MKITKGLTILMISGLFLGGCKAGKEASVSNTSDIPEISTKPMIKGGEKIAKAIPNATIFKISGDYAGNVAITLNEDGTLAYYPDPKDITANSKPYPLGNGWYLNRQGIGKNSRFTSYTFEEYKNLQRPPSHKELLASIIPGSGVSEFIEIPISASKAISNPDLCIPYIPK